MGNPSGDLNRSSSPSRELAGMAKRKGPRKPPGEPPADSTEPRNPGLPDPNTVVSERILVSPKGRRYRVITTTERGPRTVPTTRTGKSDN